MQIQWETNRMGHGQSWGCLSGCRVGCVHGRDRSEVPILNLFSQQGWARGSLVVKLQYNLSREAAQAVCTAQSTRHHVSARSEAEELCFINLMFIPQVTSQALSTNSGMTEGTNERLRRDGNVCWRASQNGLNCVKSGHFGYTWHHMIVRCSFMVM